MAEKIMRLGRRMAAKFGQYFMFLIKKDFKKNAIKLKAFFFDLLFPVECLNCGKDGIWLCASCFSRIELREKQHCLACKKESAFGEFCRDCRSDCSLKGILIAGNYEDELLSKLVKNLKYKFARNLSEDLGRFLIIFLSNISGIAANNFSVAVTTVQDPLRGANKGELNADSPILPLARANRKDFCFKNALVIPVPLHPRRERWRGFNQAELIARELADYFNLDMSVGGLIRIKHRKPQTKLNKQDRKNNIKNCFAWRLGGLSGKKIILVDDVATTGSTLNECARVLKKNGAGEIWGLVAANG